LVLLPRELKLITDQLWFQSGDKYAASARSVKGFDNALEACSQHLSNLADTCMQNFERRKFLFKEAFEKQVQKQSIGPRK
jgi:hypothetical protein